MENVEPQSAVYVGDEILDFAPFQFEYDGAIVEGISVLYRRTTTRPLDQYYIWDYPVEPWDEEGEAPNYPTFALDEIADFWGSLTGHEITDWQGIG